MYTAIIIDETSKQKLLTYLKDIIPNDWNVICHHMTINLGSFNDGPLKDSNFGLNQEVSLTATKLAKDDKVIAVEVVSDVPSINKIKHITIAVNVKNGGKPVMSNKLTNWNDISPIQLKGIILEQK